MVWLQKDLLCRNFTRVQPAEDPAIKRGLYRRCSFRKLANLFAVDSAKPE